MPEGSGIGDLGWYTPHQIHPISDHLSPALWGSMASQFPITDPPPLMSTIDFEFLKKAILVEDDINLRPRHKSRVNPVPPVVVCSGWCSEGGHVPGALSPSLSSWMPCFRLCPVSFPVSMAVHLHNLTHNTPTLR